MSSRLDGVKADALSVVEDTRAFVGEFFFEGVGLRASDEAITTVMIAIGLVFLFCLYRILKPAPAARHRYHPSDYDFGRNE